MNRRPPAVAGRLLLGSFVLAERALRRGEAARSLVAGAEDEGTTQLVGAVFGAASVVGPLLARLRRGRLPAQVGWAGVGVMAAGIGLRVWSARTLGSHYTRTLRTEGDQPVVDTGPYARIRHPGYAGTIVMWLGYGLALTSVPALVGIAVPVMAAYARRIRAEEDMLARELGEPYRAYQARTDRLVPRLY